MPRKRALLSALFFAVSSMPAFASHRTIELAEWVGDSSADFHICKSALRTYVMVERYVKGSCPADVSPEDLLEAVKYLGVETYDVIREKATQEEVDNLYARLKNAHRDGDPDILSAVSRVVFAREFYAQEHLDQRYWAPHCLGFAYRTLGLFLNNALDEDLVPGAGLMGKYFFKQSSSDNWRGCLRA